MFAQPLKIAALMREFEPDWFVAGGWAIDLFLGKETRQHQDIEIAIFRRDQLVLQNYLRGWLLQIVENGNFSDWNKGEFLELPFFEIHCFNEKHELPQFEVLLNETNGRDWIFRRNAIIAKSLSEFYLESKQGIRFLPPEVVLLYKSKNPREKDEQDFQITAKYLDFKSKEWLRNALSICYSEHHWLQKL